MIPLLLAMVAGVGAHLLVTSTGDGPLPRLSRGRRPRFTLLPRAELAAAMVAMFVVGCLSGHVVFGGIGPPLAIGLFAATSPVAADRARGRRRLELAREAWPRLIEEIRLQTGSMGRSVPQAVLDAGRTAPADLRPAFELAHREWLLTTDLARALAVLRSNLADPTADMVCETLLMAHELGATDLDRRLEALATDRFEELQRRKDARARQEAARFARRFVLGVPAGMAVAGLSIGDGRGAYRSPAGQVVVMVALLLVVGCWVWAGRVMRLPEPERVFAE